MKIKFALILTLGCVFSAFIQMEPGLFFVPKGWPKPVFDFSKQPLTQDKVFLGRVLFYDPILSRDSSVSCASCHSPYNAFAHTDHKLSHGIRDSIGTRNAPSLQLLAWQNYFMWDGAFTSLDEQSVFPVTHPAEMGENTDRLLLKLRRSPMYAELCMQAYGDRTMGIDRMKESIRQFLLTIVSTESKYDSVMQKKSTFNAQEQNGYVVFRKNCNACHTEPLFTNTGFENNGLAIDPLLMDMGRMKVTGDSNDAGLFKVPTLRNIEFSYPYMHDGRFAGLGDVINHYSTLTGNLYVRKTKNSIPVELTSKEKVDLLAFLLTLSDRKMLFRPGYGFPKEILH